MNSLVINFIVHLISLRRKRVVKAATPSSNVENEFSGQEKIDQERASESTESEVATSCNRSDEEECSVCLSGLKDSDETRTLPCLHVFHEVCVGRWLDLFGKTCPLCRFSVEKDEESDKKTSELTEEMVIWFSSFHASGF
ncbi:hypothetical protein MKW94_013319 [Papaver nudicaule]|uniref:RING-type E3 ubiquitin transferase n=1 Tax=Papaver nudicaule TaxID=74823 RepID=A0AA41V1Y5_PAPNU|nr:hypothetical protein [Papaver nudicaule]